MIRLPLAAAVAAALLCGAPARAQDVVKDSPKDVRSNVRLELATWGGGFDGEGTRTDSGGVAVIEAKASPRLRREGWWLDVPFRVAHRQTFGATLSQTTGGLDLEPWFVVSKALRVGLEAGAYGRWAPDWPDQYQRDPITGALAPTDRYSYLAVRGGAALYARPAAHQHLRARYRYVAQDYSHDPDFQPNLTPGHLTPRDNRRHELDLHWRYTQRAWALALRLDWARRSEQELVSRDALTGSINFPANPNPLQVTNLWTPSGELELRDLLGGVLELSLGYGIEFQEDTWEGYYSYTEHHPHVAARLELTKRLAATAQYEGWFRTYGPNGTAPGRLDYGTRRESSMFRVTGELGYRLRDDLTARAVVEYTDRRTNYPDYTPPGSDIDWDYVNLYAVFGLEYRM
ncbi:MAG TPA: hypothetical protein VFL83_17335 [Anaeromyxobacter sp.]|nr:hypothetical protein [Anaeromyxobacter sp.]